MHPSTHHLHGKRQSSHWVLAQGVWLGSIIIVHVNGNRHLRHQVSNRIFEYGNRQHVTLDRRPEEALPDQRRYVTRNSPLAAQAHPSGENWSRKACIHVSKDEA